MLLAINFLFRRKNAIFAVNLRLLYTFTMDFNKVLFILQEISPYLPESDMATISRKLAQGVQESGAEVRTFMPKYGYVNDRRNQLHPVIRLSGMNLIIDDMDHPLIIKVATLQPARLQVYFIFSDDYFTPEITKELEINSHPDDNDERSIFYVRGVLEAVKKQRWAPGIIHCSGWITALAPLYISKFYGDDPSFRDAKVVMSLFDEKMAAPLNEDLYKKLKFDGFSDDELAPIFEKKADYVDLMRMAIEHSHAIVQCSENINPDVLKLVEESGLPFLPYQKMEDDASVARCIEFYHSL